MTISELAPEKTLPRRLSIQLPARQSAFLWGARKTGKSHWLRQQFPDSVTFDLLHSDLFLEFTRAPAALRERLLATPDALLHKPIVIDEVQKVPALLDEVHGLIESRGLRFILCGSSARKLKRGQANLLGGRAWRYEMFPLTSIEVDDLDLLRALNRGLIPDHYLRAGYRKSLTAYTQDYLKEEVFAEGLTRNIPAFSRFFEAMAYSHGELTNYSNIARECAIDAKTVKEYYQILVDTLLGRFVEPFKRRQDRRVLSRTPRFYLFDVGVAGALAKRRVDAARGEEFGRALEHFVLMELVAHRSYAELDYDINFWRTQSGLEVDFILARGEVAVEVKGTDRVDSRDLRGLKAFVDEYHPRHAIVVCTEPAERIHDGIRIVPWRTFLHQLWHGQVVN